MKQRFSVKGSSFESHLRLLGGAAFVLLALTGLSFAQPAEEVRAVFNRMVEDATRGDEQALTKYHAPDATLIDGSGFNRGFQTYLDKAKRDIGLAPNAGHAVLQNYRVSDVDIKAAGEVAWVTYRYAVDAPVAGRLTSVHGLGTLIFQRIDNEWKVVHGQTAGRPRREPFNP